MSVSVVKKGMSAPLGATVCSGGVNFSVFSKSADLIELLLFDEKHAAQPAKVISLDPNQHRTYHHWHVSISGLKPGQIYAYRAHGPFEPERPENYKNTIGGCNGKSINQSRAGTDERLLAGVQLPFGGNDLSQG